MTDKPFDGAISRFFETEFPTGLRARIEAAGKSDMVSPGYPYRERMDRDDYERRYDALQIELVKLQAWVKKSGARVAILFEGRDAAGKGGTIKRFRENLNPRGARVVALAKPTETERGQWYFQRYIAHLPGPGEIVFYDRSWYNRAVVERVFGFSTDAERERFFRQVTDFERMLVRDGILFFKIWLTVGRAEQMRRMLARESDPLKQWKISSIDVKSLERWAAYTAAVEEMFERTHTELAPWRVVRADDKRRARLAAQEIVLSNIDYDSCAREKVGEIDPLIAGGPELADLAND